MACSLHVMVALEQLSLHPCVRWHVQPPLKPQEAFAISLPEYNPSLRAAWSLLGLFAPLNKGIPLL